MPAEIHLKPLKRQGAQKVVTLFENKKHIKSKKVVIVPAINTHTVTTQQALIYLTNAARLMGIIMPRHHKILYLIYSLIIMGAGTYYAPIGFSFIYINISEMEISNLLTSIQVTFDIYAGSIKICIMAIIFPKLLAANKVLQRLDARCHDQSDLDELQKVVNFSRRCVLVFLSVYLSYSASTFLGSVVMGHPPYSLWFPYLNWRRSQKEFIIASIIEYMIMNAACLQQTVNDAYGVIYVSILRTHMKILLRRVEKLVSNNDFNLDKNFEELKLCIMDHQNLLDLYNIISPIISITLFIQFAVTAAILGITLINITIFSTAFSARIGSCFYVLAVTTQLFPVCYYAQCLMDESNRLATTIFHSNWTNQNVRFRNMLIFFMQRAQSPMALTAGKLFPVTLSSFLSIAKFSFSLYTFIKEMNIKEKFGLE